jgi:uncharacterized membrane-anchored protein YitT (DUF2179 family)
MKVLKEYALMTIATFIISLAVFFFLVPSHAAVCSISGLAIVLSHFMPLSVAGITMILNITLLIIGYFLVGKSFISRTVYASILLPVLLLCLEHIFPHFHSLTNDPLLDVICYIFTVNIGAAMLFNANASSGGIDIVGKIMNVYFGIEVGKAMSMAGILIALSAMLAYDTKTVILSLLGTYLNGMVLDHYIFDQKLKRKVCIVSRHAEDIRHFIIDGMKSGATLYRIVGAYHKEERDEVVAIVNKSEYRTLMNYVKKKDPTAFVTVYKVSDMQYCPKQVE